MNAPKVSIILASDDESKGSGQRRGSSSSRRGSIARQEARDLDDSMEHPAHIELLNSNNTSQTILE